MRPLQALVLVLAVSGEIGKLQQAGRRPDFEPGSESWRQAAGQWQTLHGQARDELEHLARKNPLETDAVRKSFGLALLTGAIALFLDERAHRISALMADGRHKAALSTITMERMV